MSIRWNPSLNEIKLMWAKKTNKTGIRDYVLTYKIGLRPAAASAEGSKCHRYRILGNAVIHTTFQQSHHLKQLYNLVNIKLQLIWNCLLRYFFYLLGVASRLDAIANSHLPSLVKVWLINIMNSFDPKYWLERILHSCYILHTNLHLMWKQSFPSHSVTKRG